MKVVIDTEMCTGHGRCYALAPDVFDCDDAGFGVVTVTGQLDDEQLEAARQAVANCPERAVELVE